MQQLSDLLATIPIPKAHRRAGETGDASIGSSVELVTNLGAGLPEGQLHLWGGPDGAGKTSFLLSLLSGAADCQRRVLYATYDLPASTLARRLLAMCAGVAPEDLPDPGAAGGGAGTLDADAWMRVAQARRYLSGLPFSILEARGLTIDSLRDRLARMPFRANVLAVDYLQAIVRERGTPLRGALTSLTDLAKGMHVAIVCAVRPDEDLPAASKALEGIALHDKGGSLPDRVGWLSPSGAVDRRADVVANRHGPQTSMPLRVQPSGALQPHAK